MCLPQLPKSVQPGAKTALAEIWNAEDKAHALTAIKAFENDYRARFAKSDATQGRHRSVGVEHVSPATGSA